MGQLQFASALHHFSWMLVSDNVLSAYGQKKKKKPNKPTGKKNKKTKQFYWESETESRRRSSALIKTTKRCLGNRTCRYPLTDPNAALIIGDASFKRSIGDNKSQKARHWTKAAVSATPTENIGPNPYR